VPESGWAFFSAQFCFARRKQQEKSANTTLFKKRAKFNRFAVNGVQDVDVIIQ